MSNIDDFVEESLSASRGGTTSNRRNNYNGNSRRNNYQRIQGPNYYNNSNRVGINQNNIDNSYGNEYRNKNQNSYLNEFGSRNHNDQTTLESNSNFNRNRNRGYNKKPDYFSKKPKPFKNSNLSGLLVSNGNQSSNVISTNDTDLNEFGLRNHNDHTTLESNSNFNRNRNRGYNKKPDYFSRKPKPFKNSNISDLSVSNGNQCSNDILPNETNESINKKNELNQKNNNHGKQVNIKKKNKPKIEKTKDLGQKEILVDLLKKNKCECLICMINMNKDSHVWSCKNCYNIYHLSCIKKWCSKSTENTELNTWNCPACNAIFTDEAQKLTYRCFCGKVDRPESVSKIWDSIPHCCGNVCSKKLSNCNHECIIPCHPGPCPPCEASSVVKCGCGSQKTMVLCGKLTQCDNICNKTLNCAQHKCEKKCHSTACDECSIVSLKSCFCEGKASIKIPCGDVNFENENVSCGEICGKLKTCGNHSCQQICHPGDCTQICEFSVELTKYCRCGSESIENLKGRSRMTCADPIPTCNKVCNKKLSCSVHSCKNKCCDMNESEHICMKQCNRSLECGNHTCEIDCFSHYVRGLFKCPPCSVVSYDELTCECGESVLLPPIACGTPPPICHRECGREHSCDHSPVLHSCHSELECPPCVYLTSKPCLGGHTVLNNIYCHIPAFSCGVKCNKPLDNCSHVCIKKCHSGSCADEQFVCTQPCSNKRDTCQHDCGAPCHPTDSDCTKYMKECDIYTPVSCKCQIRNESFSCSVLRQFSNKNKSDFILVTESLRWDSELKLHYLECDKNCEIALVQSKLIKKFSLSSTKSIINTKFTYYRDYLVEFCKDNFMYVKSIENQFETIITELQNSESQEEHDMPFPNLPIKNSLFLRRFSSLYSIDCIVGVQSWRQTANVSLKVVKNQSFIPKSRLTAIVEKKHFKTFKPIR